MEQISKISIVVDKYRISDLETLEIVREVLGFRYFHV